MNLKEISSTSWTLSQLKKHPNILKNIFLYSFVSSILSLSIPLISQSFLTLLSQGIIIQPLVILTIILLASMIFLVILKIADYILIERIQKRLLTAFLSDFIVMQRKKAEQKSLTLSEQLYFFELFILKKGLAKLLLNIPTTILVLCVALILLPFYNGYLLFVDFLVLLGFATIYVVGKGFVSVGVVESGFKYQLITSFIDYTQQNKNENKHDDVTLLDQRMYDYAIYREKHFKVLLRQFLAGYVLQITVLVTTLGLGAYLVAVAQMTIGQLIATELLVIAMLNTLDKTIDLLETFSDVCIADYKLQHLLH